MYHRRTDCRCCGSAELKQFLQLGPQPLANSFLRSPEEFASAKFFPLDVQFCPRCSLVQIADVVSPEVLFRNYIYVTGTSETMARHNEAYAASVAQYLGLATGDLVVEAASNDGSLLSCFQRQGQQVVGVEPARNIAEMARARGVETVAEFFNANAAGYVRETYGPARAFVANNVFAHVDDPSGFLAAARSLLAEDGLAIFESPYIGGFTEGLEYDTVYHEHLAYFGAKALMHLCERNDMVMVKLDFTAVHGGSFRLHAGKRSHYRCHSEQALEAIVREERVGYHSLARWERFAADVHSNRNQLRELVGSLHAAGKTLAAYGAPAKGNTLLNFCKIGTDWLPFTVDKSPLKIGLLTPGMHLPVMPVGTLLERQPDYVLILPWNLAPEIARQQAEYQARGGQLLLPLPAPKPFQLAPPAMAK